MAQRLDSIWRHCARCDLFWRPPGDDWSCWNCGDIGLISFVGPVLGSAHECPDRARVETTWDERWLAGQFTRDGVVLSPPLQ